MLIGIAAVIESTDQTLNIFIWTGFTLHLTRWSLYHVQYVTDAEYCFYDIHHQVSKTRTANACWRYHTYT